MTSVTVERELFLDALQQRPQRMRALGRSMWPAVAPGSWLTLEATDDEPALGELWAFRPEALDAADPTASRFGAAAGEGAAVGGGGLVIHRVIGLAAGPRFLLAGDATFAPDGWLPRAALVARVSGVDDGDGPPRPPLRTPAPWPPASARALARLVRAKGAFVDDGIGAALSVLRGRATRRP